MSNYPYGYPFQGQPPQQQYHFPYQPHGAYPPTNGYSVQSNQQPQIPQPYPPATATYHAASQSAYDLNASSIPGLGAPSAGLAFPAPYNENWNQPGYATLRPSSQPSALTHTNPSSSTTLAHPNLQGRASGSQGSKLIPVADVPQQKVQKRPDAVTQPQQQEKGPAKILADENDSQDEGEISDSYFDDLYDDVPSAAGDAAVSAEVPEEPVADGSDQEPNFYDTDMEEVSIAEKQVSSTSDGLAQAVPRPAEQVERNQSRSYSPHLSPTEVQQDDPPPHKTNSIDLQPGELRNEMSYIVYTDHGGRRNDNCW